MLREDRRGKRCVYEYVYVKALGRGVLDYPVKI